MTFTQNTQLKPLSYVLAAALASAMLWTGWFIVVSLYLAPLTLLGKADTLPTNLPHWLALLAGAAVFYRIYQTQSRFLLKEALLSSLALSFILILAFFAASLLALGAVSAAYLISATTNSATAAVIVCSTAWCLSSIYYWVTVIPWLRQLVAPLTEEGKLRLNF